MMAIVDGTHRSEFAYDGMGRRVKVAEFDNGNLTSKKLYWWLGGQIVCERDGITSGFPITKRYFGQGVVVGAERLFYTFDQLGSVRELVDSSGVVRADYRYSTYGERTKEAGDLDSDWGYGGLFHHAPSGLDLATYRTYDSKMGRWISRDPLGEGVDYNLYRYCGNDPIGCVDPAGLQPGVPTEHELEQMQNGGGLSRPVLDALRTGGNRINAVGTAAYEFGLDQIDPTNPWNWVPVMGQVLKIAKGSTTALFVYAKAKETGEYTRIGHILAQNISKGIPIAGARMRRQIDEIKDLVTDFGGVDCDWKKMSGTAKVINEFGLTLRAELHWYEKVGDPTRYKLKLSKWL
jgi:RHS repeat-associated protein